MITATFNGAERTRFITSAERSRQFVSQSDWSSLFADQSSASIDGDTLTISGTFSGTLPFKSMSGNADVESQETIVVENSMFEGEIRRLQDI